MMASDMMMSLRLTLLLFCSSLAVIYSERLLSEEYKLTRSSIVGDYTAKPHHSQTLIFNNVTNISHTASYRKLFHVSEIYFNRTLAATKKYNEKVTQKTVKSNAQTSLELNSLQILSTYQTPQSLMSSEVGNLMSTKGSSPIQDSLTLETYLTKFEYIPNSIHRTLQQPMSSEILPDAVDPTSSKMKTSPLSMLYHTRYNPSLSLTPPMSTRYSLSQNNNTMNNMFATSSLQTIQEVQRNHANTKASNYIQIVSTPSNKTLTTSDSTTTVLIQTFSSVQSNVADLIFPSFQATPSLKEKTSIITTTIDAMADGNISSLPSSKSKSIFAMISSKELSKQRFLSVSNRHLFTVATNSRSMKIIGRSSFGFVTRRPAHSTLLKVILTYATDASCTVSYIAHSFKLLSTITSLQQTSSFSKFEDHSSSTFQTLRNRNNSLQAIPSLQPTPSDIFNHLTTSTFMRKLDSLPTTLPSQRTTAASFRKHMTPLLQRSVPLTRQFLPSRATHIQSTVMHAQTSYRAIIQNTVSDLQTQTVSQQLTKNSSRENSTLQQLQPEVNIKTTHFVPLSVASNSKYFSISVDSPVRNTMLFVSSSENVKKRIMVTSATRYPLRNSPSSTTNNKTVGLPNVPVKTRFDTRKNSISPTTNPYHSGVSKNSYGTLHLHTTQNYSFESSNTKDVPIMKRSKSLSSALPSLINTNMSPWEPQKASNVLPAWAVALVVVLVVVVVFALVVVLWKRKRTRRLPYRLEGGDRLSLSERFNSSSEDDDKVFVDGKTEEDSLIIS